MPLGVSTLTRAALLVTVTCAGAQAQAAPAEAGAYRQPVWTVTVGAGAIFGSRYRYLGSDETEILPVPFVDVRWRNRVFLSPMDGLGVNLIASRQHRVGIAGHADFGREESDGPLLRGLGDVDVAPELRAFYQLDLQPLSFGVVAHRRLAQQKGALVDVSLAYNMVLGRRLMIHAGPVLTWMDGDHASTYFGISPAQSLRSGLPEYRLGSGVRDVGFSAGVIYQLGGRWGLVSFLRGTRLMGDASRSPVIAQRNMGQVGTFLVYRF